MESPKVNLPKVTFMKTVSSITAENEKTKQEKNDTGFIHVSSLDPDFVSLGTAQKIMTTAQAHSTAHDDGNANELPMSIVNSNETYDKEHLFRNLSEEKAKYMWFQLLIEIIFRLNYNEYDCRQMLDECRAKYIDNAAELKKMDEFQSTFKPEDIIKWYTRDSFLYHLLNQAFRSESIDEIFKFRFFLHYLHKQLFSLHREYICMAKTFDSVPW
ncbi:unnamed protein product [Rotaria sp. Silwood1]|nr:unnamed protein product [Rotaria sp. Silwood1]